MKNEFALHEKWKLNEKSWRKFVCFQFINKENLCLKKGKEWNKKKGKKGDNTD